MYTGFSELSMITALYHENYIGLAYLLFLKFEIFSRSYCCTVFLGQNFLFTFSDTAVGGTI